MSVCGFDQDQSSAALPSHPATGPTTTSGRVLERKMSPPPFLHVQALFGLSEPSCGSKVDV